VAIVRVDQPRPIRSKVSVTNEFVTSIALFEIPMLEWTCFGT